MKRTKQYNVIDLFAGAGGLSKGFLQTGKFKVLAAVENNPWMQETYRYNHADVDMYSDILSMDFSEFRNKYRSIDVVVGGPPCQGFSNANRQQNHIVNMNNQLTRKYVDAILEINPKAFVLENVKMLASDTHLFLCENDELDYINGLGIELVNQKVEIKVPDEISETVFNHYAAGYDFHGLLLSDSEYILLNTLYRNRNNTDRLKTIQRKKEKSISELFEKYSQLSSVDYQIIAAYISKKALEMCEGLLEDKIDIIVLEHFIETQRSLMKLQEVRLKNLHVDFSNIADGVIELIFVGYTVLDYIIASLGAIYSLGYSVLNAADFGAPQNRSRFIMIGVLKENTKCEIKMPVGFISKDEFYSVKNAILDLEEYHPAVSISHDIPIIVEYRSSDSPLGRYLRDSNKILNHINTASRERSLKRFKQLKQGQNFHDLTEDFKTNYSQPKRTQNSIYKRLDYSKPAGTVVNVRKSMWIHPTKDRAISIREAARLQTFPDSYVFKGTKDSQYQQVGNAVPPVLARAVAESVLAALGDKPEVYLKDEIMKGE